MADPAAVGDKVRVWWAPTKDKSKAGFCGAWWPATIIKCNPAAQQVQVQYDNNSTEWISNAFVSPSDPPDGIGTKAFAIQDGEFVEVFNQSVTDPCAWLGKVTATIEIGQRYHVEYPFHNTKAEDVDVALLTRARVFCNGDWKYITPHHSWTAGSVGSPLDLPLLDETAWLDSLKRQLTATLHAMKAANPDLSFNIPSANSPAAADEDTSTSEAAAAAAATGVSVARSDPLNHRSTTPAGHLGSTPGTQLTGTPLLMTQLLQEGDDDEDGEGNEDGEEPVAVPKRGRGRPAGAKTVFRHPKKSMDGMSQMEYQAPMTQSQSPYDSVTNTNLGNTRCGRCGEWGHNRRTCVGAGSVMSPSSENNVPLSGGEKVRVSRGHKKKKGTQSADEDGDYSPEAQEEDGGAEGASVAAVKSDGSRRRRETGPTAPRCPRSAWNVFMERHRAAVVARMPVDVAQADLLKALSEEYRNLDVETREPLNEEVARDKLRYEQEMATYNSTREDMDEEEEEEVYRAKRRNRGPNKPKTALDMFTAHYVATRERSLKGSNGNSKAAASHPSPHDPESAAAAADGNGASAAAPTDENGQSAAANGSAFGVGDVEMGNGGGEDAADGEEEVLTAEMIAGEAVTAWGAAKEGTRAKYERLAAEAQERYNLQLGQFQARLVQANQQAGTGLGHLYAAATPSLSPFPSTAITVAAGGSPVIDLTHGGARLQPLQLLNGGASGVRVRGGAPLTVLGQAQFNLEEEALSIGLDHRRLKEWLSRHHFHNDAYYLVLDAWRGESPRFPDAVRAWRAHLKSSNRIDWQAFMVSTLGFDIVRTLRLLSGPQAEAHATAAFTAAAATPTATAAASPARDEPTAAAALPSPAALQTDLDAALLENISLE